jgi:endothelin-converting enzyme
LDFPTYFGALFPRNFPETVIITYPPYLEQLSSFLAETETDVLQAYFIARAAFTLAPYLSTNTEPWKIVRELEELLNGLKKGAIGDREEWCLTQVENALGFAVGRFFVEREFGGKFAVSFPAARLTVK